MPPLQERSVNILSKPEIRAQVVALRREGWTFGAIAVAEDIPKSTARDIVSRWNQRSHNNDASRSGRPKNYPSAIYDDFHINYESIHSKHLTKYALRPTPTRQQG